MGIIRKGTTLAIKGVVPFFVFGDKANALDSMKSEVVRGTFNEFVSVNDHDLKEKLGLIMDDEGNYYNPLAKDLDNDGIPDR